MAEIYNELGWSERAVCGKVFMVPPPESTGTAPFDLVSPEPQSTDVDPDWLRKSLRRPPVHTQPLPTECYDVSWGRVHVQPHCRCPKVKGKRK